MSGQSFRTHTCGALRKEHVGQNVTLAGWLRNRRDHGGITFVDLADHYGVTQIVIDPHFAGLAEVNQTPKEPVIQIHGQVVARTENTINTEMPTGTIEVQAREFTVLGIAEPLPLSVFPEAPIPEDLRLKYRYLDLRRSKVHANMVLRSRVISSIRRRMEALGFAEFQTPTLTSSSPEAEGARDYLVTQDEVFSTVEILFKGLFEEFAPGTVVQAPFPRLTYDEAMLRYASDKPDLRNPIEIVELSDLFEKSGLTAFAGKTVRAILAPNGSTRPRSFFDKLEDAAKKEGAPGLVPCPRNTRCFVAIKMGRRQGGPSRTGGKLLFRGGNRVP
jgi:aspartyl-tRNA synthetase